MVCLFCELQELLACLLDGLSEDLNLVTNKPYIEYPDSNDRPDAELADIWWKNHSMRDFSVIQTLFSGQFKSVVTCKCKFSSARFEPFMFLTLPLPEETARSIVVYVSTLKESFARKCCVRVPKDSTLVEVVQKIVAFDLPGVDDNSVFTAGEVINSKVVLLCSLSRRVGTIRDSDNIFIFQVPGSSHNPVSCDSRLTSDAVDSSSRSTAATTTGEQLTVDSSSNIEVEATLVQVSDASQNSESIMTPQVITPQRTDSIEHVVAAPSRVAIPTSPRTVTNCETSTNIRVIFVQRKITLSNGGGIECYRMDSFGLPIVLCKLVFSC